MSNNIWGAADSQPRWIRTRQRPADPNAASVNSGNTFRVDGQQQQAANQQSTSTTAPLSPSAGFASSFSAFFPRTGGPQHVDGGYQQGSTALGDYPLFSSRRAAKTSTGSATSTSPPFAFSPPSPHAASLPSLSSMRPSMQLSNAPAVLASTSGLSALQYSTASKLRRPSVLATSSLPAEGDEDLGRYHGSGDMQGSSPSVSRLGSVSIDSQDECGMSTVGEDIDMDLAESSNISNGQHTVNLTALSAGLPRTAAIAIPGRARSHSQSSSVMASSAQLARSPSAWPNSPPRSGLTPTANPQHLLARLTSEQQQAMAASASSASSAYYMIPSSYRQAMTSGNGGDILLGGVGEEAVDDASFEEEDENPLSPKTAKPSSGLSRSFNPLNPYSERPPTGSKRNPSREADRDTMSMDDSPEPSVAGKGGMAEAFHVPGSGAMSGRKGQSASSGLRVSQSSPALPEMKVPPAVPPIHSGYAPGVNTIPFPSSSPSHPTTPPQQSPRDQHTSAKSANSGLRRSQSTSHCPGGLVSRTSGRDSGFMIEDSSTPLTAPAMSNAFRFQRANSLSDFSQLQRKAGYEEQDMQLGSMDVQTRDTSERVLSGPEVREGQNKDRQASGSSGSDSPYAGPRVVRRAVSHKKGSLMPKSKDHLRTMAQLRLETGEFEVASEAALHRISQSSAAAPSALGTPSRRHTTSGMATMLSPFASLPRAAGMGYAPESSAGISVSGARPTSSAATKPPFFNQVKNRFPESVADEEDDDIDSSGSEPDYASAAEAGFDPASASDTGGNMMVGEDEDVSSNAGGDMGGGDSGLVSRSAWTLRDPTLYKPPTPGGPGRLAGEMDLSPSSVLSWSAATRPGKRKFNDGDRFEPYNAAFKRRAVSPASASSVSLSPLLATRDLQGSAIPAPPSTLATLGPAAQISSAWQNQGLSLNSSVPPSPVVSGGGTWLNPNKSRGNSPANMASSSAKRFPEEDKERKAVDLSKMSIG